MSKPALAITALLIAAITFFAFAKNSDDPTVQGSGDAGDVTDGDVTDGGAADGPSQTPPTLPADGSNELTGTMVELSDECADVLAPADSLLEKLADESLTNDEQVELQDILSAGYETCTDDEWFTYSTLNFTPGTGDAGNGSGADGPGDGSGSDAGNVIDGGPIGSGFDADAFDEETTANAGSVISIGTIQLPAEEQEDGEVVIAEGMTELGEECEETLAPSLDLIEKLANNTLTDEETVELQELLDEGFEVCSPDEWHSFTFTYLGPIEPDAEGAEADALVEEMNAEQDGVIDHDPSDPNDPSIP